ncbi:hypothetical protein BASA60_000457 [Batrachochytrium salamandrivorans]|nr:hypothetical protein BASA60_000457 [Batrachochytrium salamandrivorans]
MTNPPSTDSGEIHSPQTRYQESDRSSESLSDKSNQQARKRTARSDDERPISIAAHPNSPDPEFDSDDSSYDGNGENDVDVCHPSSISLTGVDSIVAPGMTSSDTNLEPQNNFQTINLLTQMKTKPATSDSMSDLPHIATAETLKHISSNKIGESKATETPREYQLELLELAKKENIIAVLATGAGKTLVALLLIVHLHSLQRSTNTVKSYKISVMLVPTVTLVSQQAKYLKVNSKLRVSLLWGGKITGQYGASYWKKELAETDVIVMTAEIFRTSLDRGYISIDKFNLIVFDECHHARSDHPYSVLMRTHFSRCPETKRPKILGITASPVLGKDQLPVSLDDLQKNLYSRAVTSTLNADVRKHTSVPIERVVYFHDGPLYNPPRLYFEIYEKSPDLADALTTHLSETLDICDQLGPWCSERILEFAIIKYRRTLRHALIHPALTKKTTKLRVLKQEAYLEGTIQDDCITGLVLDEKSKSILKFCSDVISSSHFGPKNNPISVDVISPKVQTLIDVLFEFKDLPRFCGIVFVTQRVHANVIQLTIASHPALQFLRPMTLVGHGGGNASKNGLYRTNDKMTTSNQQSVVDAFRNGSCNILIATQVAEEGLDIRPCNAVIRFDAMVCLTNYIQSRGRARHAHSQFIVLSHKGNKEEERALQIMQSEETRMRDILETSMLNSTLGMEDSREPGIVDEYRYVVPATGAVANTSNAIKILHEFCATISVNGVPCNPVYAYVYDDVLMPYVTIDLPLKVRQECRSISGPSDTSKKLAKRRAALELIKNLHIFGELDDYLGSTSVAVNKKNSSMSKSVNASKVEKNAVHAEHPLRIPTAFQGSWVHDQLAWLSIIVVQTVTDSNPNDSFDAKSTHSGQRTANQEAASFPVNGPIEGGQSTAWQSNKNSPPTDIMLIGILTCGTEDTSTDYMPIEINGVMKRVRIDSLRCRLKLTHEMISSFRRYHLHAFSGVLRSPVEEQLDWAMLCVPILPAAVNLASFNTTTANPNDIIDWGAIKYSDNADQIDVLSVMNNPEKPFVGHSEIILLDHVQYARKYTVVAVCYNKSPTTVIPSLGKLGNIKGLYKGRLSCKDEIRDDQAPLRAICIGPPVQNKRVRLSTQETFLLPQFCTVFPIQKPHLQQARLLPLIIRHLWHRLLARDIKHGHGLVLSNRATKGPQFSASLDLLQMATTASSALQAFNYERLETLGDSFLKIHQSLHLFAMNPNKQEGWMTVARIELEQNGSLHQKALDAQLQGYILTQPLARQLWVPPAHNYLLDQSMSKKTLADVVEAIIGACVYDGGVVQASLAVSRLLGDAYKSDWREYYAAWLMEKPTTTFAESEHVDSDAADVRTPDDEMHGDPVITARIEAMIGYTFTDKRLLWEMLTHSSAAGMGNCYQRLEFLGDAVLSYLVMQHLYAISPPLNPGGLSMLRSELVCNQFLACVTINLGLTDYIQHNDVVLGQSISEFTQWVHHHLTPEGSAAASAVVSTSTTQTASAGLFWNKGTTAPKTLGDVYEALLGAVFLDSKFDLQCVSNLLDRTLILPWWWRFTLLFDGANMAYQNPIGELRTLAFTLLKCIDLEYSYVHEQGVGTIAKITCHGRIIGKSLGTGQRDAKKAASCTAVEYLNTHKSEMEQICDCQAQKMAAAKARAAAAAAMAAETAASAPSSSPPPPVTAAIVTDNITPKDI